MDEIVLTLKTMNLPGFRCPHCGGAGRMADGALSIGLDEIRIQAATQCGVCMGKGRVRCVPISDEEDRAAEATAYELNERARKTARQATEKKP